MKIATAVLFSLVTVTGALPGFAQDTRAGVIAQQQADKAGHLRPFQPGKAQRIFLSVKSKLLDSPSGAYPLIGSDTLRGFTSWRFHDRHSVLLQGEFCWIPNRTGVDVAIFYDAGKVTSRRTDLDLKASRAM